jgi:sterol desaturase/sphingolipid hydroxylase (fatty acid hydroxylase superfamily)
MLLSMMLIVASVELLSPIRPQASVETSNLARNLFYLFLVTQLTATLLRWAEVWLNTSLTLGTIELPHVWPQSAPFALKVALAFFVSEFFSYWFHRAAHANRILWQFHSTHHVITQLTALSSLRTHPIDNLFFYVVRTVPLLIVGAGSLELVAAVTFAALLGLLAHANMNVSSLFGTFINLPSFHALHHDINVTRSNSNFGCHTVFWDRCFGTFRGAEATTQIGIEPVLNRSLWRELVWPFYRWIG